MADAPPTQDVDAPADYFDYFFVRSKKDGSVMSGSNVADGIILSQPMRADHRGLQLLKPVAISATSEYVKLIFKGPPAVLLDLNAAQQLVSSPVSSTALTQQWRQTAIGQWENAGAPGKVLGMVGAGYAMVAPNVIDKTQQFEMLYPSDFVYIRHCSSGKYLTAYTTNVVSWQPMIPAQDAYQQWGVTSDGFLVNRGTANVLQLSATTPALGLTVNLGAQAELGANAAFQRFDATALDGAIHSRADSNYVLAKVGSASVIMQYSETDNDLLIEFISPFQFFVLTGCGFYTRYPDTVYRSQNLATVVNIFPTTDRAGLLTVSRYGELISPVDGFVLQSQGDSNVPKFVDPELVSIGNGSTTFIYTYFADQRGGSVRLRGGGLWLSVAFKNLRRELEMKAYTAPNRANTWNLKGPANSVFGAYSDLAQAFFLNPVPLPGQALAPVQADAHVVAFTGQLSKTQQVIKAIVLGALNIFCGVSPSSVADSAIEQVAIKLLGNASINAKIAIVIGGVVTADSIMAVLQAIGGANLWRDVIGQLIPNSFWGWVLLAANLIVGVAEWATGIGPAITGLKVALVVAEVIRIVNSDAQAITAELVVLAALRERAATASTVDPVAAEVPAVATSGLLGT